MDSNTTLTRQGIGRSSSRSFSRAPSRKSFEVQGVNMDEAASGTVRSSLLTESMRVASIKKPASFKRSFSRRHSSKVTPEDDDAGFRAYAPRDGPVTEALQVSPEESSDTPKQVSARPHDERMPHQGSASE